MSDGRILFASNNMGKVMEYDGRGKLLHEWDVANVATVTGLPNGHILASCHTSPNRIVEVDRAGKIVWEQQVNNAYRARRR
jgi:hypothetical protein